MTYTGATNGIAGTLLLNTTCSIRRRQVNAGLVKVGPAQTRVVKTPRSRRRRREARSIRQQADRHHRRADREPRDPDRQRPRGRDVDGSGIITSSASGTSTTARVATAGHTGRRPSAGVSVTATDTLVMYTYAVMRNLDGKNQRRRLRAASTST
jgi:hypothetical protein